MRNYIHIKKQQGIVLLSSLLGVMLMMSVALLLWSIARFWISYRHLQVAADAGALAGVAELHSVAFTSVKNTTKN